MSPPAYRVAGMHYSTIPTLVRVQFHAMWRRLSFVGDFEHPVFSQGTGRYVHI